MSPPKQRQWIIQFLNFFGGIQDLLVTVVCVLFCTYTPRQGTMSCEPSRTWLNKQGCMLKCVMSLEDGLIIDPCSHQFQWHLLSDLQVKITFLFRLSILSLTHHCPFLVEVFHLLSLVLCYEPLNQYFLFYCLCVFLHITVFTRQVNWNRLLI